jgi:hypothetical protein
MNELINKIINYYIKKEADFEGDYIYYSSYDNYGLLSKIELLLNHNYLVLKTKLEKQDVIILMNILKSPELFDLKNNDYLKNIILNNREFKESNCISDENIKRDVDKLKKYNLRDLNIWIFYFQALELTNLTEYEELPKTAFIYNFDYHQLLVDNEQYICNIEDLICL